MPRVDAYTVLVSLRQAGARLDGSLVARDRVRRRGPFSEMVSYDARARTVELGLVFYDSQLEAVQHIEPAVIRQSLMCVPAEGL